MNLKNLPVIISGSLVALSMTCGISQAATVITFSVNSSTSNPSAKAECTTISCNFINGNNTGTATLNLTATNQTAFRYNDTPYPITSLDYVLQGSDASNYIFSPTGNTSSIFSKIQVLNNGAEILFSGGNIAPGAYFSVARSYNPQSTNTLQPFHTVTFAVSEPNAALGLIMFGVFAVGLKLKQFAPQSIPESSSESSN